ncbi:hypothetical protein DFH09DRAFT_1108225 [Mycena vulgaris]|nr:hypothetical protein DFH09DRAFT_1108225 [Mycena vulgaris]
MPFTSATFCKLLLSSSVNLLISASFKLNPDLWSPGSSIYRLRFWTVNLKFADAGAQGFTDEEGRHRAHKDGTARTRAGSERDRYGVSQKQAGAQIPGVKGHKSEADSNQPTLPGLAARRPYPLYTPDSQAQAAIFGRTDLMCGTRQAIGDGEGLTSPHVPKGKISQVFPPARLAAKGIVSI